MAQGPTMAIAALLLAAAVGLRTGNMPDFSALEDYALYLLFDFWIGGCAFALGGLVVTRRRRTGPAT